MSVNDFLGHGILKDMVILKIGRLSVSDYLSHRIGKFPAPNQIQFKFNQTQSWSMVTVAVVSMVRLHPLHLNSHLTITEMTQCSQEGMEGILGIMMKVQPCTIHCPGKTGIHGDAWI